jgi:hypothetical protein
MKKIEDLTTRELLDMYKDEIQRLHYDPCDSYDRAPFDANELRAEIERRIGRDEE